MENISFTLILAQIGNFLILYLLFKKLVAEKLFAVLEERFTLHEKLKEAEKEKELIISEARTEKIKILAEAKKEASQYLKNARDVASQRVKETMNKANRDVKMIITGGERQLEKDRNVMLADLKEQIIDMSIKLNKKLFDTPNINKQFLEGAIEKMK